MARYCMSNNIKTRMALRAKTGNCVYFSSAQIHPYSCCSNWHISCIEWNFRGPLAQNRIIYHHWVQSDFSMAPKSSTSNKISIHTFTYTQDTSIIGTHTGPGPARPSGRNSTLPLCQPRGNVCSIIRTCSYLKKKKGNQQSRSIWRFYSEMLNKLHSARDSHLHIFMCSLSFCLL